MHRDRVAAALRIACGVGLIAAGAAMLVLPGPGILTLLVGAAVLSPEWLPPLRRWMGREQPRPAPARAIAR